MAAFNRARSSHDATSGSFALFFRLPAMVAGPVRIAPLIPHKDNEKARHDGRVKFDATEYKRRSVIEQTIGWLKECRRIATRFEKLAINFLAMMKLAMIQRCLRIEFSDRA